MSETQSQKSSNLARIRDNQRRSRARRKEYLQELETKYRECEQAGVAASAEIQAAARRVVDENKRLRQLLRQHGLTDAEIGNLSGDDTAAALDSMLDARRSCNAVCSSDNNRSGDNNRTSGSVSTLDSPAPAPSPQPTFVASPQQQLHSRLPQVQPQQQMYPQQPHLASQPIYPPILNSHARQPTWPPEMYAHASRTAQLGVDYTQYPTAQSATATSLHHTNHSDPYAHHQQAQGYGGQSYNMSPYPSSVPSLPQDQNLSWLHNYPTAEFLKGVPHPHLQPAPSSHSDSHASTPASAAATQGLRTFKPEEGFGLSEGMGCRRCVEGGEGCRDCREVWGGRGNYGGDAGAGS